MRRELWCGLVAVVVFGASAACGDDETSLGSGAGDGTGATGGTTSTTTAMTGGGGTTTTTTGDGGGIVGGGPPGYPPGPYGNTEGDIFPPLVWQGYLSTDPAALATTETWTDPYTALDLHTSGASYALIHTSLSG